MKKVVCFIFCLWASNFIQAQYNPKPYYGLKAGANYSQFMPNELMKRYDDIGYFGKFGFYLGAFVNFELTENIKIQPELMFTLQGSRFNNDNLQFFDGTNEFSPIISNYRSTINESTIALPILVQFFINDLFYFEIGSQLAYVIDTTEKITEIPVEELAFGEGISIFNDIDKFDFGASVGLGYKLSDTFILNGRYFFSLIDRSDTIKSSVFYLGVDYQL
ncbi:MAG: porin family protein [Algibacter sp.]